MKRIFDSTSKKGGKWLAELLMVISGLRTQPSKATGQTPFFLVYGSEAILPADIMWKSPRLEMYDQVAADGTRQLNLDSLDEIRCNALLRSTRYLQNMRWYHDHNIQTRSFNIGDMVLHRIQDETGLHKLNSRWEGPFIISRCKPLPEVRKWELGLPFLSISSLRQPHYPGPSYLLFSKQSIISPLMHSTWPLALGCATDTYLISMLEF